MKMFFKWSVDVIALNHQLKELHARFTQQYHLNGKIIEINFSAFLTEYRVLL